ncbi:MAG: hypothetical protein DHS20C16_15690 [Phycisphaerae bacterium]|nr:MAG: hypothetical protein DHS20C16_15690 [Phycisphaerae bacterium]
MEYVSLGNPIWSGQAVLQGGWRRLFWSNSTYGLILVAGCAIAIKSGEFNSEAQAANWALRTLGYLQIAVLYLSGMGARAKALTRDHTSVMLESIRIAPMRSIAVVSGYVFGPIGATLVSWMVGGVVGFVLIQAYGLGGAGDWLVGNIVVLASAMSAWSLQVFLGVGLKKPNNAIIGLLVACFFLDFSRNLLVSFPGLTLFLGLHPAMLGLGIMRCAYPDPDVLAVGLLACLIMSAFWWWAAAKRFRRPDLPALGPGLALIFCGLWSCSAAYGYVKADALYSNAFLLGKNIRPTMRMIMCFAAMIVVCIPISSAMQMVRVEILRLRNPLDRIRARVWPYLIASLALAVTSLCAVAGGNEQLKETLNDSIFMLSGICLMSFGLFRWSCIRTGNPTTAWTQLVAYWILPVIVASSWFGFQVARHAKEESDSLGILFTASPIGGFIAAWMPVNAPVRGGIVVQFILAVVVIVAGYWLERSFRKERFNRFSSAEAGQLATGTNDGEPYSVPSNNGDET